MRREVAALLRRVPPLRRVDAFRHDPAGAQRRVLRSLLQRAAGTEWGRRHGFAAIAEASAPEDAFRERVPITRHADLRADIERMRRGDRDVLWPGRVTTFARSTGTTGEPKVLPCTDDTLRQWLRFGAAVFLSHVAATGDLRCLGASITMAGMAGEDPDHPGTRLGDVSALAADYFMRHSVLGRWLGPRQGLTTAIRAIPNVDDQMDALCDFAMERDIRVVTLAPSWALAFFERLRVRYNSRHRASAATVGEIWPNLRLFVGGGVPLSTYRTALERTIGLPGVTLLDTYGASETVVAFQDRPHAGSLLLDLDGGTYFEFVRAEDASSPAPRRFTVADVATGVAYVPVVSTCSGLWAYVLGDVVRFARLHPHELTIEGRTSEMVDSYGEKVTGAQAHAALRHASEGLGVVPLDFHVVPRPAAGDAPHAHRWLVEFDGRPPDAARFARLVDEALLASSATYADCRRHRGFGEPEVVALPPGALRQALESLRGPLGVQGKVPRTSDRSELADAALSRMGDAADGPGKRVGQTCLSPPTR